MSSIPNLNTLRSGRRGPRLRGRRGGPGLLSDQDGALSREASSQQAADKVVQQTDGDASSSRMSAVSLGYLDDPYAKILYQLDQDAPKRYPIINRGTYVRTKAIDKLVLHFLNTSPTERKQIVSLGAGSDTRFFRLCAGKYNVAYHELDFEQNVFPKRTSIRGSSELSRMAVPLKEGSSYHLHAIDLRDLTNNSPPILPGFDEDIPTLIISECCLCYLLPDLAISVLNYFAMHAREGRGIILYEPIRPFDAFGKTMVRNLASRGIELRTLKRYYSLEAQRQRLRLAGYEDGQGARDVYQIWEDSNWVESAERERIEKIEWLDEVEEWKLLARHYTIAWGWRGRLFDEAWKSIEGAGTMDERLDEDMG